MMHEAIYSTVLSNDRLAPSPGATRQRVNSQAILPDSQDVRMILPGRLRPHLEDYHQTLSRMALAPWVLHFGHASGRLKHKSSGCALDYKIDPSPCA